MKKIIKLFLVYLFLGINLFANDDPSSIAEICKKSVVVVNNNSASTVGTGFFINSEGWILTNWHVVNNQNDDVEVKDFNGNIYKATKIITYSSGYMDSYTETYEDIALIKIEKRYNPFLKFLKSSQELQLLNKVIAIGHSMGDYKYTTTLGDISNLNQNGIIQHTAAINPGNSGGPLILSKNKGLVVGINTSGRNDANSIFFAIHLDNILNFLNKHRISYYTAEIEKSDNSNINTNSSIIAQQSNKPKTKQEIEIEKKEEEMKLKLREKQLIIEAELKQKEAKIQAEIRQKELENLQRQKQLILEYEERKQNEYEAMIRANNPSRIIIMPGANFGLNIFDIENHLNGVDKPMDYYFSRYNLFLGYRGFTSTKNESGTLISIFASYLNISKKSTGEINSSNRKTYETNYNLELEGGFIIEEILRISTGIGTTRGVNYSKELYDYNYLTSTLGLYIGYGILQFNLNYNLQYGLDYKYINNRLEIGVNLKFGIIK